MQYIHNIFIRSIRNCFITADYGVSIERLFIVLFSFHLLYLYFCFIFQCFFLFGFGKHVICLLAANVTQNVYTHNPVVGRNEQKIPQIYKLQIHVIRICLFCYFRCFCFVWPVIVTFSRNPTNNFSTVYAHPICILSTLHST